MCLIVLKGSAPQIAQTDILCYKVIRLTSGKVSGHHWKSPYQGTKQPYNKVVQAKDWHDRPLANLQPDLFREIASGFHAFVCESSAIDEQVDWTGTLEGQRTSNKYFVRKAIIPKGTEYCIGIHDDIVATHMIVFGSDKAYWNYKLKNDK